MTGRAYNLSVGYLLQKVNDGEAYVVNHLTTVGNGNTTNLHIRNPENSAASMWVCGMSTILTEQGVVRLHDHFDSITDGDEFVIQNAEMDTDNGGVDSGPFKAYADSTYTVANNATIPLGVSGSGGVQTIDLISYPQVCRQGREFVIEVENNGSSNAQVLISLFLTEN